MPNNVDGSAPNNSESDTDTLRKCCAYLNAVEFFEIPADRIWTRNFCPIFVKRDRITHQQPAK